MLFHLSQEANLKKRLINNQKRMKRSSFFCTYERSRESIQGIPCTFIMLYFLKFIQKEGKWTRFVHIFLVYLMIGEII